MSPPELLPTTGPGSQSCHRRVLHHTLRPCAARSNAGGKWALKNGVGHNSLGPRSSLGAQIRSTLSLNVTILPSCCHWEIWVAYGDSVTYLTLTVAVVHHLHNSSSSSLIAPWSGFICALILAYLLDDTCSCQLHAHPPSAEGEHFRHLSPARRRTPYTLEYIPALLWDAEY